ncbi:unnamed protein product [Rotaria sp. Silwood1]|nr:unnamed protein product [Rotaria sp. Silwood1]CAF1533326.1 unnamed protein product [Rotaria sp. Silwood1]
MAKDRMKDLKNSIPKSDASYQQLPQVQNHNTLNIVDDCGIPLTSIDIDKEHKVSEFLDRINSLRERIDEIKVLTRDVKKIYERMRQPEPDPELEKKLVGKNAEIKKLRDDIRTELQKLKQEYQFQNETQESAQWRIRTVQILKKTEEFYEIMNQYYQEYCKHRDKCEKAVLRELRITGRRTTQSERDEIVVKRMQGEDIIPVIVDKEEIRQQAIFIEERYHDIQRLESTIVELHDMFVDFTELISTQGKMIDNIQQYVLNSADHTEKAVINIAKTTKIKESTSNKKIIVCIIVIVVIIILILIFIAYHTTQKIILGR